MVLLFKLIVLTVIIVMGLKIAMSDEMIFEKVGKYLKRKIDEGNKILEMFYCQWCMASFYSLVAHGFAFGLGILPFSFNWQLIIRLPLVIMGASFVSGNIWNLYETINRVREKNEQERIYFENLNNEDT